MHTAASIINRPPTSGTHMTRRIAGLAAAGLMAGGMTLAAFGLSIGAAQADPELWTRETSYGTWCPGQRVPGGFTQVNWDWKVCHDFLTVQQPVENGPSYISGLKARDVPGGPYRLVAGEPYKPLPNRTCQIITGRPC